MAAPRIFVAVTSRIGPFVERIELGLVDPSQHAVHVLGAPALGSHFLGESLPAGTCSARGHVSPSGQSQDIVRNRARRAAHANRDA